MKMQKRMLLPPTISAASVALLLLCPTRYNHFNYVPASIFVLVAAAVVEGSKTSSGLATNNETGFLKNGMVRMRRRPGQQPRRRQIQDDTDEEDDDSSTSVDSSMPTRYKSRRIRLSSSLSSMVEQCSSSGSNSSSSGNFQGDCGNTNNSNGRRDSSPLSSTRMDSQTNIYYSNRSINSNDSTHSTTTSTKKGFSPPSVVVAVPPIKRIVPQPRKKELWLPWPLGAIRNDFYSFAASEEEEEHRRHGWNEEGVVVGGRQQPHQHQQQHLPWQQQWQIQPDSILHRSRDWATKMLHRGGGSLRRRMHGNSSEVDFSSTETSIGNNNMEYGSNPRLYWSKDSTTSMATASATMGKKDKKQPNKLGMQQKQQQQKYDGTVRGGENNAMDPSENAKHFDKDVVLRYLKLQASVRLRQLGYGKAA
jgi:hypothetical protein